MTENKNISLDLQKLISQLRLSKNSGEYKILYKVLRGNYELSIWCWA